MPRDAAAAARRRALRRDERGVVSIITAALVFVVFGLAAAAVDFGSAFWLRRELQAAADAAAMAGSFDLSRAAAIVAQSTAANGVAAGDTISSTAGTYTGDPSLAPASRFAAGGSSPNALRVTIAGAAPVYFLGLFLTQPALPIQVAATAANIAEGSFSAGTGLASLNNGILNALLGGLFGSSVSLSLVNYQALAQTDISLLSFTDALATELGVTSGTYGDLLSSTVTMGELLAAAESVAGSDNDTQAVAALSALDTGGIAAQSFELSDLLDLGAWDERQIGSLNGAIEAAPGINLLDLIEFGGQVLAGGDLVSVSLPVSLSGISAASLSFAVGEPAQNAPRIGLGPVGTTIHTAQIRVAFNFSLAPLLGSIVHLPLYVEAAAGTATLSAITCGSDPLDDAVMAITGAPGLATTYVASVAPSQMTNFSAPVSPSPGTILNVAGLVTVTADVAASLSAPTPSTLDFSYTDIDDATVQTLSSTDFTGGLLTSLSTSLGKSGGLTVTILGLGLGLGSLGAEALGELQPALSALDPLVNTVLQSLGVELGTMDLRATGMRCGIPVIVN